MIKIPGLEIFLLAGVQRAPVEGKVRGPSQKSDTTNQFNLMINPFEGLPSQGPALRETLLCCDLAKTTSYTAFSFVPANHAYEIQRARGLAVTKSDERSVCSSSLASSMPRLADETEVLDDALAPSASPLRHCEHNQGRGKPGGEDIAKGAKWLIWANG